MQRTTLATAALLLAAITSLSTSANAQQTEVYVSLNGSDANPICSPSAPCYNINNALTKVTAGGKIFCLDQGRFNNATITKSVTIDCAATGASIPFGSNDPAIIVNAGPSDRVILRNLHLYSWNSGSTQNGVTGIRFLAGGELEVDNVVIEGVNAAGAGIDVNKSALGVLSVRNSTFSRMNVGIRMQTSSGNIVASVTNTSFNNLTNTGIQVGTNSYASVHNSIFSAVYGYGINAATSTSTVYATDNVITNTNVGISATVAGAKINANGNKLFGNSKAFNVATGATFLSGGGNNYDINPGNPATGSLGWK